MVRAKFRLNSYTTEMHQTVVRKDDKGIPVYGPVEKRTLNFTPVYSAAEGSENKMFWDATPSGSIQLGVVNRAAWEEFELGKEYYVDFAPACACHGAVRVARGPAGCVAISAMDAAGDATVAARLRAGRRQRRIP